MLTKKTVFILFVVLLCAAPVFALSGVRELYPDFSEDQINQLLAGETFKAYSVDGQIPSALAPEGSTTKIFAMQAEANEDAFSQSLVSFVPYPESWSGYSEEQKFLGTFNLMQKVSTMKGITYNSFSAGGEATLFSEAYLIANPKKKNSRIEDYEDVVVPSRKLAYAFMKDTKFGGNIYELDYYAMQDEIFLEITNIENMKYLGISCVKAKALHMYVDTVMTKEGILVYGLAICYNQKPSVKVLVTTVDLPSAFLKRVDSLKEWFVDRVREVK